ncbi:hypothetical protein HO133_005812 [Letharia lupina]|uniref:Uncharacterized protein n=1 Tax=Letharia lupina TaxID=560253 RepID=A0A8H6F8A9_9LECA|nr:uncharacterized protein HO133_005812 [Letharia lupina]KAF6218463.1 hypothetical protein HO133_005812 [Letharia lupina]
MAPSRKKNVSMEHRTRSRSPMTRPQPIRTREELSCRETRRSSSLSLSSRDHRIPIDCPFPGCNATTVHQHYDNVQFFNPHPAPETRHRGYASSRRVTSLQPNVVNGVPAMRGQETFGPEILDEEEAAQEQDGNLQSSVAGGDEKDVQEKPIEQRTLITTLKVAAPEVRNNAQRLVALADLSKEQQAVGEFDGAALEEYTVMDEGISDLSPGDPITSRRTLDFVEDLLTPLQTIPLEIDYETIANAWDSRRVQQQPEESPTTTSPGLQDVFDEWLVPKTPEQASETLPWDIQSLGHSLNDLSREDGDRELPSNMMRPPPDSYKRQFPATIEDGDDFEAIFGLSGKD